MNFFGEIGFSMMNLSRFVNSVEHATEIGRCLRLISVSTTLHGYATALREIVPVIMECVIFIICVTYSYAEAGFLAFHKFNVISPSSPLHICREQRTLNIIIYLSRSLNIFWGFYFYFFALRF
jgi:hypothetical protein